MLTVSQHAAQIRSHADTASNEAIVVEMGTKDRKWKLSLRVSGDSHRRGPAYPAPARLPMLEALLTGATRSIPSIWHEYGMQRDEPPTHPPTVSSAPRGGARRNVGLHLEVERGGVAPGGACRLSKVRDGQGPRKGEGSDHCAGAWGPIFVNCGNMAVT